MTKAEQLAAKIARDKETLEKQRWRSPSGMKRACAK